MTKLPEGSESWQYRHQNYARLLLKESTRDQIETILKNINRINGDDQEQIMRDFLNHEKLTIDTPLAIPQCVLDEQRAVELSLSKDEQYQKQKADIAASDKFVGRLAG